MKDIIVAVGLFSRLSISLKDETVQKLALISKKNNPLAQVETDLNRVLDDFERKYFQIVHPDPAPDEQEDKEKS